VERVVGFRLVAAVDAEDRLEVLERFAFEPCPVGSRDGARLATDGGLVAAAATEDNATRRGLRMPGS